MDRSMAGRRDAAQGRFEGRGLAVVLAILPFVLVAGMTMASPTVLGGSMGESETWLGLPPAGVVSAAGLAWGLLGAVIVWRNHRPIGAALALLLFTVPGLVAFVFGPGIVLIFQNLG